MDLRGVPVSASLIMVLCQSAAAPSDLRAQCLDPGDLGLDDQAEWLESDERAARRLLDAGLRWIGVVEEEAERRPATELDSYVRLSILLRSGLEIEAVGALEDLADLCPQPDPWHLRDLMGEALDREAWTLARRLPETFEGVAWNEHLPDLLERWLEDEGWTPEQVAQWLEARHAAAVESCRDLHADPERDPVGDWLRMRLTFLLEQRLHEPLVRQIESEIRDDPTNARALLRYLRSLPAGMVREHDLSWLPDHVEPTTAFDAYDIGRTLEFYERWSVAEPFYRAALEFPWTEDDARRYTRDWSAAVSTERAGARFQQDIRERISQRRGLGAEDRALPLSNGGSDDPEKEILRLRKTVASEPPDSFESQRAVNSLLGKPDALPADDEVLWTWLDARSRWGWPETRLLRRLLEEGARAKAETGRNDAVERALRLTDGTHWSRAYATGSWLKQRGGDQARAIPLLRRTLELTDDDHVRSLARRSLRDALADEGDWRKAERIARESALESSDERDADELRRELVEAALAAARAGAHADALRLWSTAMPIDLSALHGLEDLADHGLREDLVRLYRDVAVRLPASTAPGRALTLLGEEVESGQPPPPV